MDDMLDIINNLRARKGQKPIKEPKLSKSILKSCRGCALTQSAIGGEGCIGGVKEASANTSMFTRRGNDVICELGYKVKDHFTESSYEPIPLERCMKPRTRKEYFLCQLKK